VNQKRMCSIFSSRSFLSTARRDATVDVARSFDFTIVERLVVALALALAISVLLLETARAPGTA
jgi:hypothetical protein